jgi:outer membrane protein TolC
LLTLIVTVLLTGCAVGPDFVPPRAPDVSGYERGRSPTRTVSADVAGGEAQRLVSGRDIPGEWWHLFRSRPLKTLMADALNNNHDLQAAQAALRVARENAVAGAGAFFPSVDAGSSATRQKVPADFFGEPADPSVFNVYTVK